MGYQESYVTVYNQSDFDKLVSLVNEIGEEYYEKYSCKPVRIITLNQTIKGNLSEMCQPEIEYEFGKGFKFIYFVGERGLQRTIDKLFNGKGEELDIDIFFTECFPSKEIFDKQKPIAEHEPFEFK
jgi:hypothetical protein